MTPCVAFEKGVAGHSVEAISGFLRVRMAVDQHQSLACMQGHRHATERQRTGLQTTGSQLIPRPRFRQARLRTTPFGHAFRPRLPATLFSHAFQPRLSATPAGHVFRRIIRIEDVMHFGRTDRTTETN